MMYQRNSWTRLVIVLTVFCLVSCTGTRPESPAQLALANRAELDQLLDSYVETGAYPAVYARLEDRAGRVIYEHGSVNATLLPDTQVDGQTWYRIWSMSKIVTIAVTLDLVEDEILKLDDPVTKYLPEFAALSVAVAADGADLSVLGNEDKNAACPLRLVPAQSVMTVLDLINHKAGFYYATTGIACLDALVAAQNLPTAANSQALIEQLARLPLNQQPGTRYFYGTNTTVLGLVAERASGQSLKQLVEQRVTGPLQINGLQYGLPPGVRLLPPMSGKDGALRVAQRGELDIFGPDVPDYDPQHQLYLGGEGMLGTADGYADFLRMLLNRGTLNGHRLLETATVAQITSPHTQLDNEYGYNGFNLWINSGKMSNGKYGTGGLWIGGGYEGTHFWIDPKRGFVGVIMSQMYWVPQSGWGRDDTFREAVYKRLQSVE